PLPSRFHEAVDEGVDRSDGSAQAGHDIAAVGIAGKLLRLFRDIAEHPGAEAARGTLEAVGCVLPLLLVHRLVEAGEIDVGLAAEETEQFVFERAVAERVAGEMNEVDGAAVAG